MSRSGVWSVLMKSGKEFCLRTSIHGFNHIAMPKRHWTERIMWVIIAVIAAWGVVDLSLGQFQRYNDNPTVVTLEKDFRSWHFPLPGVTICDQDRLDASKLSVAIKSRWGVGPDDGRYPYYVRFVEAVANSDLFHLEAYQEFRHDGDLEVDLYQLAIEVMPERQVKTIWSGDMEAKWTPVMTEAGVCHAINSLPIDDVAIFANNTVGVPLTCKYSSHSCYVMFESSKPIDIYVHSPYDIADVTGYVSRVFLTLNRATELSVTETKSGREVRSLRPHRRRCRYNDEPPTGDRRVYSTNSCRLSCRSRLAIHLCGCRPFYYFYAEGKPCGPSGMLCLASFANQLARFDGVKCSCSQQCVDAVFREISTVDQLWNRGLFLNRGAIRLTVQAPRTRYTREIVFHFEDLVVSFGGAAGLFLGASFISFVEILYFFLEKMIRSLKLQDNEERIKKTGMTFERTRIEESTEVPKGRRDRRYRESSLVLYSKRH